jgi:hypothetical protein
MGSYRKKPVVIEAFQFSYGCGFPEWFAEKISAAEVFVYGRAHENGPHVLIPTLEGEMTASPGDWIIQGVKGEIYPCKPDIFTATYDEVGFEK